MLDMHEVIGSIPTVSTRKKHICNADVLFCNEIRLRRVKSGFAK